MRNSSEHLISHHNEIGRRAELRIAYLSMCIRSFALALVGVFVPLFLYKSGFSFQEIIIFFLVMFSVEAILEIPACKFAAYFSSRKSIAISLPFLIIFFALLLTINTYHWNLYFLPAIMAISAAFFWQAYHYEFAVSKEKGKTSKNLSSLFISISIISAVAPFVGGYVGTNFGMNYVFAFIIIFLLASYIIFFRKAEQFKKEKVIFNDLKLNNFKRDIIAAGGAGLEGTVSGFVWPFLVFLIIGTYQGVGFVLTVSLLLTILITRLMGRKKDSDNKRKYIKTGAFLLAIGNVLRSVVFTVTQILTLNVFYNVGQSFLQTPFFSEYYLRVDELKRKREYVAIREIAGLLAKVVLLAVLLALSYFYEIKTVLIFGLILGVLAAFMMVFSPRPQVETK